MKNRRNRRGVTEGLVLCFLGIRVGVGGDCGGEEGGAGGEDVMMEPERRFGVGGISGRVKEDMMKLSTLKSMELEMRWSSDHNEGPEEGAFINQRR